VVYLKEIVKIGWLTGCVVVVVDSEAVSDSSMSLMTDTVDHPPQPMNDEHLLQTAVNQHEHLLTAVNHDCQLHADTAAVTPADNDVTDDVDETFCDAVEPVPGGERSRDGVTSRCRWWVLLAVSSSLLAVLLTLSVMLLMCYVLLESDMDLTLVHSARRLPEICHFYRDQYLPWRGRYLPWRRAFPPHWPCLRRTAHSAHDVDDDDDDDDDVSAERRHRSGYVTLSQNFRGKGSFLVSTKLDTFCYPMVQNCIVLRAVVLTQCRRVTDRRTDGRNCCS